MGNAARIRVVAGATVAPMPSPMSAYVTRKIHSGVSTSMNSNSANAMTTSVSPDVMTVRAPNRATSVELNGADIS